MPNYPYDELPRNFVDALGIKTGYYETGKRNGRPIIMLHGMSTSADSFREAMHELADELWLIAPDIPGFGYSENANPYTMPHLVEWLADFVAALDLPPAALVGHSFGGTLAGGFAAAYPDDVTRLLLTAPALLRAESYPNWLKKIGFGLHLVELGSVASQSKVWLRRQIRAPFYDAAKQDDSVWERRLQDYALSRASASVLRATAFYETRPFLSQINHPTCLLWGEDDPVVPVAECDALAELLPNVQEVHKLAECGHVPPLEHQEKFQEVTQRFLG
ncbi:MAG: alpha/beta hydrolase [Chloroflexi bacterium]|nr:alpha/beta hydrolase [Chloroflexota bacterium]